MSDGPVCHIPPASTRVDPVPVGMPAIPPAQANLHSLVNTVNAMRQVIMILSGQQGTQGRPGAPGKDGKANNTKGTWIEHSRVMEQKKIFQNNDPSSANWVIVDRLNQLVMRNKDTGQTWSW